MTDRPVRYVASLSIAAVLGLAGCSTQQAYSIGQGWQRNQCEHLPDRADVQHCMERSGASYDAYKREAQSQQAR